MSSSDSSKVDPVNQTFRGWKVGDVALRKGRLCTIIDIDFLIDPPSCTVRMHDDGNEVGTEFSRLSKPPITDLPKEKEPKEESPPQKLNTSLPPPQIPPGNHKEPNLEDTVMLEPEIEKEEEKDDIIGIDKLGINPDIKPKDKDMNLEEEHSSDHEDDTEYEQVTDGEEEEEVELPPRKMNNKRSRFRGRRCGDDEYFPRRRRGAFFPSLFEDFGQFDDPFFSF